MNQFYTILDLIKNRLESNPLVHTTIFARLDEKDLYKKQIYPIAHIIPIASPFINSQVTQFTFDIGVFEQRDINKFPTEDKFTGNDNVIDNLNLTSSVLIDLVNYLQSQNNENEIELVSIGNMVPIQYNDFNIMDGWTIQLTLQIPNDMVSCGNAASPQDNQDSDLQCGTDKLQYLYGSRSFNEVEQPSLVYQFSEIDLDTIISYWKDNITKGIGLGGAFLQKCGSGINVGDVVYGAGGPLTFGGYFIVDKSLPDSGFGNYKGQDIRYRRNPARPIGGNPPTFYQVFSEPCVINVEIIDGVSVITEVFDLPTDEFMPT